MKQNYEKPTLDTIEVQSEQGFAASETTGSVGGWGDGGSIGGGEATEDGNE